MTRTDAVFSTYPAGLQNVSMRVYRGRPRLDIRGIPATLADSMAQRIKGALGDLPGCRIVAEVIRPGGAYASDEVEAVIVAGIRDLTPHVLN